jgi:hypothetical protein
MELTWNLKTLEVRAAVIATASSGAVLRVLISMPSIALGWKAIHYASNYGCVAGAELLLDAGCTVSDASTELGYLPLHFGESSPVLAIGTFRSNLLFVRFCTSLHS